MAAKSGMRSVMESDAPCATAAPKLLHAPSAGEVTTMSAVVAADNGQRELGRRYVGVATGAAPASPTADAHVPAAVGHFGASKRTFVRHVRENGRRAAIRCMADSGGAARAAAIRSAR